MSRTWIGEALAFCATKQMDHVFGGTSLLRKLAVKGFVSHHHTCGLLISMEPSGKVSTRPNGAGGSFSLLHMHQELFVGS